MAWAVQFGGIVACQAYCSNSGPQTVFGTSGEFSPKRVCSYFYAFPWFKTSYQFFILLCTVACMVTGTTKPFRNTLTLLRAIGIVLSIDSTNNFLGAWSASTGILRTHVAVVFGGDAALVICLFLTEIVQATDFDQLWHQQALKDTRGASGRSSDVRGALSA
ncbi:g8758 [Coccomyxa viridis]|uniref:G8758 protein n=1 Tax=Coccomyxa viridis TaxID=1274662 RepID=A0ABP1G7W6_9CHLO